MTSSFAIKRKPSIAKAAATVAVLLCVLSYTSCRKAPTAAPDRIVIASFNLKILGPTKASNSAVMSIMGRIIREFDIVAVQEIRDESGNAVEVLKNAVNADGVSYDYVIGPREGRTSSKEQYAFFYDTATIEAPSGAYTFHETGIDIFEREPFIAHFRVKNGNFDFALIDSHIRPDAATAEIAILPAVIADASGTLSESDVICVGDFNADGSYYDESAYSATFPASSNNWLISNDFDTTLAGQSNAYDRIVTTKSTDQDFTRNAGVFRFDLQFNLDSVAASEVTGKP